jgi:hypothetical protein
LGAGAKDGDEATNGGEDFLVQAHAGPFPLLHGVAGKRLAPPFRDGEKKRIKIEATAEQFPASPAFTPRGALDHSKPDKIICAFAAGISHW